MSDHSARAAQITANGADLKLPRHPWAKQAITVASNWEAQPRSVALLTPPRLRIKMNGVIEALHIFDEHKSVPRSLAVYSS